jgi:hypothetical protein
MNVEQFVFVDIVQQPSGQANAEQAAMSAITENLLDRKEVDRHAIQRLRRASRTAPPGGYVDVMTSSPQFNSLIQCHPERTAEGAVRTDQRDQVKDLHRRLTILRANIFSLSSVCSFPLKSQGIIACIPAVQFKGPTLEQKAAQIEGAWRDWDKVHR